eukprot:2290659-Prymnesium_polylepis.1
MHGVPNRFGVKRAEQVHTIGRDCAQARHAFPRIEATCGPTQAALQRAVGNVPDIDAMVSTANHEHACFQ